MFLIKLQASICNFIKTETLPQVFSCEFWEICKNTFFIEDPRWLLLVIVLLLLTFKFCWNFYNSKFDFSQLFVTARIEPLTHEYYQKYVKNKSSKLNLKFGQDKEQWFCNDVIFTVLGELWKMKKEEKFYIIQHFLWELIIWFVTELFLLSQPNLGK